MEGFDLDSSSDGYEPSSDDSDNEENPIAGPSKKNLLQTDNESSSGDDDSSADEQVAGAHIMNNQSIRKRLHGTHCRYGFFIRSMNSCDLFII